MAPNKIQWTPQNPANYHLTNTPILKKEVNHHTLTYQSMESHGRTIVRDHFPIAGDHSLDQADKRFPLVPHYGISDQHDSSVPHLPQEFQSVEPRNGAAVRLPFPLLVVGVGSTVLLASDSLAEVRTRECVVERVGFIGDPFSGG